MCGCVFCLVYFVVVVGCPDGVFCSLGGFILASNALKLFETLIKVLLMLIITIFYFMQFLSLWLSENPKAMSCTFSVCVRPGEMKQK